jgi:hypothetical protein
MTANEIENLVDDPEEELIEEKKSSPREIDDLVDKIVEETVVDDTENEPELEN